MERIHEPARELDVIADADVVVIGGGPGGIPDFPRAGPYPPDDGVAHRHRRF